MKRSLSVLLRDLLIVCLSMPMLRRHAVRASSALLVFLGALICLGTEEARPRGNSSEFVLPDSVADKEAGKLLTTLTDGAVPVESPILDASLASMEVASAPGNTEGADAPAEQKDAPSGSSGDAGSDKAGSAAPAVPAPAAETSATPNSVSQDFAEVDELDLFLFELADVE